MNNIFAYAIASFIIAVVVITTIYCGIVTLSALDGLKIRDFFTLLPYRRWIGNFIWLFEWKMMLFFTIFLSIAIFFEMKASKITEQGENHNYDNYDSKPVDTASDRNG